MKVRGGLLTPSDDMGYASVLLDVSFMITDLPSCVAVICCCGFSSTCLENDNLSFLVLVFFHSTGQCVIY